MHYQAVTSSYRADCVDDAALYYQLMDKALYHTLTFISYYIHWHLFNLLQHFLQNFTKKKYHHFLDDTLVTLFGLVVVFLLLVFFFPALVVFDLVVVFLAELE